MTASERNGLLLFNKQPGITSFNSLTNVKKAFNTKKVGHTGTLDKFASGLLLILVGRAVKLNFLFQDFVKEYIGTIYFGKQTDTLDPEGAIIAEAKVPSLSEVENVLGNFRGEILQAPPAYSAIHINGRRAYELARSGIEPEMKMRSANIFELEIISWAPPTAQIRVLVSAGTYIRSLARDIALAAGSRAHLSALERTRVGPFRLEEASDILHPIDINLFNSLSIPSFITFSVDDDTAKGFIHGKPLIRLIKLHELSNFRAEENDINSTDEKPPLKAAVFRKGPTNELIGIIEKNNGKWGYLHVFADY